jgi:cytochrome c oxidase subunit 2
MKRGANPWRAALGGVALLLSPVGATPTQPVHEMEIVASKYAFEPSTIQVAAGEPVRLIVRSKDGTHGFSVPQLQIDVRIPKTGDPVTVEFTAPPTGRYEIACSEFCGSGHGQMKAQIVSVGSTQTR